MTQLSRTLSLFLFSWAVSACGPGCITARVLISPDRKFDPSSNGVDTVIAMSYLTLGVGGGAALGHNAPASDGDERLNNTIRGGLLGMSLGLPVLVGMDYFFARTVSPFSFDGPLLRPLDVPMEARPARGFPARTPERGAGAVCVALPVTLLDFQGRSCGVKVCLARARGHGCERANASQARRGSCPGRSRTAESTGKAMGSPENPPLHPPGSCRTLFYRYFIGGRS